jgi:hypothetical protein
VVSFTLQPLYPQGKSPWYPLDRRLGGPQRRPGSGGEEKNSQSLAGLEPPIIQRNTTELSRLTDQIFCVRYLQVERREYNGTVHQLFIDFEKACDSGKKYCTTFSLKLLYV